MRLARARSLIGGDQNLGERTKRVEIQRLEELSAL